MAAIPALPARAARSMPRWPLFLIASPAAVAVWSGWVALGAMCGFGEVNLLPGIGRGFTLNTAITLPVGVEAYGAYALGAWLWPGTPERARAFAGRSSFGSLLLGAGGQVIYHLLAAAHATRAPWPVVVFVSCLPVIALGFGAALAHLLHLPPGGIQVTPQDELQVTPGDVPQVTVREPVQVTLWTRPDPLPQVMTQIATRPAAQVIPEAPVQVTLRTAARSPLRPAFRSPRRPAYRVPAARRDAVPQVTPAPASGHPPAQPPEHPSGHPANGVANGAPGHPLNGIQLAPQVTPPQPVQATPVNAPQVTPLTVRRVTPRRQSRAARKRASQVTPARPSDSDLEPRVRSLLESDPDVSVKAAAKVLGTGRDRARRLLDAERRRQPARDTEQGGVPVG